MVSRGVLNAQIEGLGPILDTDRFLARVSEIEQKPIEGRDRQIIEKFREGMRRNEQENRRRPNSAQIEDTSGNDS
jgi:hypothetical protein